MSRYDNEEVKFSDLVGKTITEITGLETNKDEVNITCSDGTEYIMTHYQDCCENVSIDDICGDLEDLLNTPIVMAEEVSNSDSPAKDGYEESHTWTFYKIGTNKGSVTIKWYGTSNGCYSESVAFERVA